MGYPMMSGQWPTHQPAQQLQSGMPWADDMEVDNKDQPQPPPTRPPMGRQEGLPSKKKIKGRRRATPKDEEGSEAQDIYQDIEEEHSILLNSLEHESVGHIVAREAVMNPSVALAFSQLTTIIDDLRHNLEWANNACRQAENQLVIAQRKRLATPRSPQQGEDNN